MTDAFRDRMLAITRELREQGVGAYTSAPPLFRVAWRLGLRIRPPLYQPFGKLAFGAGAWFTIAWGLVMWLTLWRTEGVKASNALVAAALTGAIFGLSMGAYYRWKASRLRLPTLDSTIANDQ
jgi:membrane associated rhomboid family serine protease